MSGDNPFASSDNPFATSTVSSAGPAGGAWGSTSGAWGSTPSAATNGYAAEPVATVAPVPAVASVKEAARDDGGLSRREAELNRREAELRKLEMELRSNPSAKSVKNWPKFCPILHHDIAGEVPAANQGMVRRCYWAWLGLIWCMFFNFVCVSAALIGIGSDKTGSWLWSIIWMLGGVPGAYILWYARIYNAAIKDSAFGYAVFFAGFMANLVFCIWSAVAPPILSSWSHAGFMSAISAIGDNTGVGVMYFIGAAFWSLESLWSLWTLKFAYASFRGNGMTAAQVKRDAAARAAASAV
eukprot:scaffold18.g1929.t1